MKKQHLPWLDVMKGFAMILVVLGHVGHIADIAHPICIWFSRFHMPFFFMLSGFLAIHCVNKSFLTNIKNKARSLLIPFVVGGLAYALTCDKLQRFITHEYHAGYWFLLSLFTCWLIFVTLIKVLKLCKLENNILIEAIVLILPFFIGNALMEYLPYIFLRASTLSVTIPHYRFFILGYLLGKIYFNRQGAYLTFYNLFKEGSKEIITAVATLVFICIGIGLMTQSTLITYIPTTFLQILLCLSLFVIIHRIVNTKPSSTISLLLMYIGRNSLPVYVFHYYFLYQFPLNGLGPTIPPGYQILIALLITTIVLIATVGVASIFNQNKILALLFLGRKYKKQC